MNRKEYKQLVENWNNFLLLEEKIYILEERLIKKNLINENLLKKLRSAGVKKSVIIPVLLIKGLLGMPNTAYGHNHNSGLPTYPEVRQAADAQRVNPPTEYEYKQACKVGGKFNLFGEGDVNQDRNIFGKIFNKSNNADIEQLFVKAFKESQIDAKSEKANEMFPGIYTKVTAKCLGPNASEKATNTIYNTIKDLFKNKSSNIVKVDLKSDFDLHVGLMNSSNFKGYAEQITKIFFEGKLSVKKNGTNDENLKNEILGEVSKVFYKLLEGKKEKGLTFPYHYFSHLFNQTLENLHKEGKFKDVSISLDNIQDGSHGGLILLGANTSEAVVEHELGHILSMNFDDVRQNTNNAYYGFVSKIHKSKQKVFDLSDVVDFLLEKVKLEFNLDVSDIDDLNENGKEKLVDNAKLIIGMLKGGGGIKELKNGKFKLEIDPSKWDIYLHSLEERIETINHSLLEGHDLDKASLIKILKTTKAITEKGEFKMGSEIVDIGGFSEWQTSLKNGGVEWDISKKIMSLMGVDNMSVKSYNKEYVLSQLDNLIKLSEANF